MERWRGRGRPLKFCCCSIRCLTQMRPLTRSRRTINTRPLISGVVSPGKTTGWRIPDIWRIVIHPILDTVGFLWCSIMIVTTSCAQGVQKSRGWVGVCPRPLDSDGDGRAVPPHREAVTYFHLQVWMRQCFRKLRDGRTSFACFVLFWPSRRPTVLRGS